MSSVVEKKAVEKIMKKVLGGKTAGRSIIRKRKAVFPSMPTPLLSLAENLSAEAIATLSAVTREAMTHLGVKNPLVYAEMTKNPEKKPVVEKILSKLAEKHGLKINTKILLQVTRDMAIMMSSKRHKLLYAARRSKHAVPGVLENIGVTMEQIMRLSAIIFWRMVTMSSPKMEALGSSILYLGVDFKNLSPMLRRKLLAMSGAGQVATAQPPA